jgi:hypothetical protein
MSMKPNVRTKEVKSQATPLANDVLGFLQRQIQGGTFGGGFGALQQQAGTGIQQFVNSGGGSFDRSPQIEALKKLHGFDLNKGMADLSEMFGQAGGRFGSGLAGATGDYVSKSNAEFENNIGSLLGSDFANQQNRLLSGLGLMGQMGESSMAPFWQMAMTGINPENVIVDPSKMQQISGLAAGIGSMVPKFQGG